MKGKVLVGGKSCVFLIIVFILTKKGVIYIPDNRHMLEYQFDMFTVATVFAGFSFAVLGMLLGMCSIPMMDKLKDTSIVTQKSEALKKSVFYFCASGFFSLLFIMKIDQSIITAIPKSVKVMEGFYILEFLLLIAGILYFVFSTGGVFNLISEVYGANSTKYKKKRTEYEHDIKKQIKEIEKNNETCNR